MKRLLYALIVAGLTFAAVAAPGKKEPFIKPGGLAFSEGTRSFRLWEHGAPGALGHEESDVPSLTYYAALNGIPTAVIVAPGGGYTMLAANHEGRQVANWLNAAGITAFVLRYRLEPRYDKSVALADAQRAVRFVRTHAAEFGVRPDRIGMMGFSAGGHLTATVETRFDMGDPHAADSVDRASSRPDFAILAYAPAPFTPSQARHGSSWEPQEKRSYPQMMEELTSGIHVTAETPPTFFFATSDDKVVPPENSVVFYLALHHAHVPAEIHIFQSGGHGDGLALGDPALSAWPPLVINWLRGLGMMAK